MGGVFGTLTKKEAALIMWNPPPQKKFIGSGDSSCEKHDVFHPQKHAIDWIILYQHPRSGIDIQKYVVYAYIVYV